MAALLAGGLLAIYRANTALRAVIVIASFVMGREAVRAFGGNAPPMSDDRPWAEFEAPKWIYGRTVQDTIALLRERHESPLALLDTDDLPKDKAYEARARIQWRRDGGQGAGAVAGDDSHRRGVH